MPNDSLPESGSALRESRRQWIKKTVGGCAGLAVGGLMDVPAARAAAQKLKLSEVSEFTTSCKLLFRRD